MSFLAILGWIWNGANVSERIGIKLKIWRSCVACRLFALRRALGLLGLFFDKKE
jgi:hypothetical protein